MFWDDLVHLTQMEFFLKYWYIYAVIFVIALALSFIPKKKKRS